MNCLAINNYHENDNHDVTHCHNHKNKNNMDNLTHPILEPFRRELELLLNYDGWQFVTADAKNSIVMNRVFYELDEISIQYKNTQYHFSLPIPNSTYSYYKKFTHVDMDTTTKNALHFLKTYINTILSYSSTC
jgi:hypothetical protein